MNSVAGSCCSGLVSPTLNHPGIILTDAPTSDDGVLSSSVGPTASVSDDVISAAEGSQAALSRGCDISFSSADVQTGDAYV